jgi:hypothetical protein
MVVAVIRATELVHGEESEAELLDQVQLQKHEVGLPHRLNEYGQPNCPTPLPP